MKRHLSRPLALIAKRQAKLEDVPAELAAAQEAWDR